MSLRINYHNCTITFSFNQLKRQFKDYEGLELVNQQKKNQQ